MALVAAGIPVVLVDESRTQLDGRLATIRKTWESHAARGRIAPEDVEARMALITPTLELADVGDVDLVIEAVFEQMAVKKQVFAKLDAHARPGAVLATNTSTLDVDEIATATSRPESVIGLHFFSPAHVMRLLEVVRGEKTSEEVVATAMALAKRIRKVPVLVGVCDGFVGNRIILVREAEALRLLLEGATPQQVDAVLRDFGFPMGSFEMQDMSGGIELLYRLRQETGAKEPIADRLGERGRFGVKAGKGFYRYEPGDRTPHHDPEVDAIIEEAAEAAGVTRSAVRDAELADRLLYPMVNEGAKILEEGIALRASDIDVVYVYGYGWPIDKGGPMYWADQVGLGKIRDRLRELAAAHGPAFAPAPLLERLADDDGRFTNGSGA
jgi:3-hydroxyacyl-CoA dehydrogenase